MTYLHDPIFTDDDKAREHLEAQRWPDGAVCPHCGVTGEEHVSAIRGARGRPSAAHPEGAERKGLYQCNACRQQFTVTVGTVFERSKVPLNKWLLATYLLSSSKKGISAHQLHRTLDVTYKTAWFMCHRIREAMIHDTNTTGPLGGKGKIIEADETYFGTVDNPRRTRTDGTPFLKSKHGKGPSNKRAVVALVERGGRARMVHLKHVNKVTVREVLVRNASRESKLFTDESKLYTTTGEEFAQHRTTNHSAREYARGEVHSNSAENVFSVFKRGMIGIYQHCGEAHLQRYVTEFEFRFNHRAKLGQSDTTRHNALLRMIEGKRLTYRRIGQAGVA